MAMWTFATYLRSLSFSSHVSWNDVSASAATRFLPYILAAETQGLTGLKLCEPT